MFHARLETHWRSLRFGEGVPHGDDGLGSFSMQVPMRPSSSLLRSRAWQCRARGRSGAGIFSAGELTVNTCTISGNRCGNGGNGGLGFRGGSANGADGGSGGGIYSAGKLELSSCTVALNQGGTGGAGGESLEATPSPPSRTSPARTLTKPTWNC